MNLCPLASGRFVLLSVCLTLPAGEYLLHLLLDGGIFLGGVYLPDFLTEIVKLLAQLAGAFFLSCCLAYLADGILNLPVGLAQQFLGLLLGTAQDGLAFLVYLFDIALVACDGLLDVFLTLVDSLAFLLPLALVAPDVLQVFVALYVVLSYYLGGIADDFLGESRLACYLDGEGRAWAAYL